MHTIHLFLLIILIWFFYRIYKDGKYNELNKEKFVPIEPKRYPLSYQQRSFKDIKYTKNLDKPMPDYLCCKITRHLDNKNGEWYYQYKKLKGKKCKPYNNNIPEINKTEYYYVGSKNWDSNDKCSSKFLDENKQPYLGSCRNLNFECLDFVDKKTCDKFPGYTWSHKTCMDNIKFPIIYKENKHYLLDE